MARGAVYEELKKVDTTSSADTARPDGGILVARGVHGSDEYRFCEFPNGNPKRSDGKAGQIKVFVCSIWFCEKRIPFSRLPTAALQRTFVELTGRTPGELGVVITQ
ncbi:MAG: hypothetical protein PHV99_03255 [Candidatus Pacebacteria bacterium]|nr:hypothetical protein [Candidatus Paceibacterota bacterium]